MEQTIKLNAVASEKNWLIKLTKAICDPAKLLNLLKIPDSYWPKDHHSEPDFTAEKHFALKVPQRFIFVHLHYPVEIEIFRQYFLHRGWAESGSRPELDEHCLMAVPGTRNEKEQWRGG